MKSKFLFHYLLLLFSVNVSSVQAANINAGEQTAKLLCSSCHGEKGISKNSRYPHLAGQTEAYLNLQLDAFKQGSRDNADMKKIAAKLSDEDIMNLAAFFASMPLTNNSKTGSQNHPKYAMCAGCHGESAQGQGGFPRLANQHSEYLTKQLQNFAKGSRKGGPMPAIASGLTAEEISKLSQFLTGLTIKK